MVPVLVPVPGDGAQCLVRGMYCWCQWMVLVLILVSMPGPGSGDSAWYHCLLCGAHAGAGIHCPVPEPVPSGWYQWLLLVPGT